MSGNPTSTSNPYVGTWRLISAELEADGKTQLPFGERPLGMLTFTEDMHYVEVLMDGDLPRFSSEEIGQGTDDENRAAAARTIGMFGTYSVNEKGEFAGDEVEGSTFPNWIGDVRTQKEISAVVDGDRMHEEFRQPTGAVIKLNWKRMR